MVSIINKYYSQLCGFSETPLQDAKALLSYALNSDPCLIWRDLTPSEEAKMADYIEKRKKGEPVAYIVGEKEFMSLPFFVNSKTLIPRPDTEIIVETLIEIYKGKEPKILDLCCGSGCIGISLAHFIKKSVVDMADLSEGALAVARENVKRNNLSDRVSVFSTDVLKEPISKTYDLIVSNPPYISSGIVKTLDVSRYEPNMALDGGEDGLVFYRALVPKAYDALLNGGILAFEIGYDQGEAVTSLMREYFSSVSLKKDYGGNDRMVWGIKKGL
jgi:release factor glutamine methyltransferase